MNEVKEILEVTKSDEGKPVAISTYLPKRIHKLAMRVHRNNPRTWNFHDTLHEIIEAGSKALLKKDQ